MTDQRTTIAIMTSGGDAPGMNAAIQGAYCNASELGYRVLGIRNGFTGLLEGDLFQLQDGDVKNIIQMGGTILGTSRCEEFQKEAAQRQAAAYCVEKGIHAVIVIGGDGSFSGAQKLAGHGIGVVGIPATIDLDIGCTDYTIGFDTAVNSAMESIDKIRDTSRAHSCCSVIEVMGRRAGYIALWCGIANTAKTILVPEKQDTDSFIEHLRSIHFTDGTVIVAEGCGRAEEIAGKIQESLKIHTRANVLGFLQRGGSPTCKDRLYGCMMGAYAADMVHSGRLCHVVVSRNGEVSHMEIDEALSVTKPFPDYLYHLNQVISKCN